MMDEFGSHALDDIAADVGSAERKSELQDSTQRGGGYDEGRERTCGNGPQVFKCRRAGARTRPQGIYVQTRDPGPDRVVLGEKALPPIGSDEAPCQCHPAQSQQCLQVELVLLDARGLRVNFSRELRQSDARRNRM